MLVPGSSGSQKPYNILTTVLTIHLGFALSTFVRTRIEIHVTASCRRACPLMCRRSDICFLSTFDARGGFSFCNVKLDYGSRLILLIIYASGVTSTICFTCLNAYVMLVLFANTLVNLSTLHRLWWWFVHLHLCRQDSCMLKSPNLRNMPYLLIHHTSYMLSFETFHLVLVLVSYSFFVNVHQMCGIRRLTFSEM